MSSTVSNQVFRFLQLQSNYSSTDGSVVTDTGEVITVTAEVVASAHSKGLMVIVWVSRRFPGYANQTHIRRVNQSISISWLLRCDCEESWCLFRDRGVDIFTSDLPEPIFNWIAVP